MTPRQIDTKTGIAPKCGHPYDIEVWINDRGEPQDMHRCYSDPDDPHSAWDAREICQACYHAKMNRRPMSFTQMTRAFQGR